MKTLNLVLSLLVSNFVLSQTKVSTLNYDYSKVKASLSITDNENKKVVLINQLKTSTDYLLFDENISQQAKISEENIEDKKEYLGSNVKDNSYYTYWRKDKVVLLKELDFSQNIIKTKELDFSPEKKDKNITSVSLKEKLYLLNVNKETNFLNIYILEKDKTEKKSIDLSKLKFVNAKKTIINFYDICSEENIFVFTNGFNFEPKNNFSSLVYSAQKKKVYTENNKIILAFDNNNNFTQTVIVNLDDFSVEQKIIGKQNVVLDSTNNFIDSNSYIVGNYIFQVKTLIKEMFLTVKDFNNNEIKSISYKKDNFGSVFNSELILEDGKFSKRDTLKNSNEFIRKVYEQKASINVKLVDDKYYIYLGGVSYPKQNKGTFIGGTIGGLSGALLGTLIAGIPDYLAINSYADRRVVHTKVILDKNLNHLPEKAETTKLENLRFFLETEKKTKFQSIFSLKENLFLTSYDDHKKEISFYKF